MNPSLLIRLRPTTPWRIGPESGSLDDAPAVFSSDALYSAVCQAFQQFGWLEEWLSATATEYSEPAVRFTSCFPWQRGFLYVPPPAALTAALGASTKLRWKGVKLLPSSLVAGMLRGERIDENEWIIDAGSGCLIPAGSRSATGPFRLVRRSSAAVDRLTGGNAMAHRATCLQFAPASGFWCAATFANPSAYAIWSPRIEAAFRLLADSGLGGMRSRGFGRSRTPDFQPGDLSEMLFGPAGLTSTGTGAWWLLSLYSPSASDAVDWTNGNYRLKVRTGRVGTGAAAGELKLSSRLVAEGSVLVAEQSPVGAARNVAPAGAGHPIYRAGFAVAIPIPWPVNL